jgi:hypothetical protein
MQGCLYGGASSTVVFYVQGLPGKGCKEAGILKTWRLSIRVHCIESTVKRRVCPQIQRNVSCTQHPKWLTPADGNQMKSIQLSDCIARERERVLAAVLLS